MLCRKLFLISIFTLIVLETQSHSIQKRGLLSKLFGGSSKLNQDIESGMSTSERSKLRELLKNPVVVSMLTAAVGMAVQQALAAKNMNDICENKYVKMAYMAGGLNPQIQQIINLLGCSAPNRKYGSNSSKSKYGQTTTPSYENNDENQNEEQTEDQDDNRNTEETLESGLPNRKDSKLQQILSISRGEKGAKRNFLKNLFGLSKKDKTFKAGHKLPSSSYKLDKDDANSMKELEKEMEQYNKVLN